MSNTDFYLNECESIWLDCDIAYFVWNIPFQG